MTPASRPLKRSSRSAPRRTAPAVVLAMCLVVAACTEPTTSASAEDQVLRTASTRDLMAAPQGRTLVFETLLVFDDDGDYAPQLAESWEVSEDQQTYTFELRDGVAFHDGTPFDADTAAFSISYAAGTSPFGRYVDSVEATDESTVTVELNEPYAFLLSDMANELSSKMISPTSVVPEGDLEGDLENYVGTGPFVLDSFAPDSTAELSRNEDSPAQSLS